MKCEARNDVTIYKLGLVAAERQKSWDAFLKDIMI